MDSMPTDDRNIASYAFFRHIAALPFVDKVVLFGSRARGDHHDRSDIDLAVFCGRANADDWREVKNCLREGRIDTLLKVDCVRFDDSTSALREQIHRFNIAFETLMKALDAFLESRHRLGPTARGVSKFELLGTAYRLRLIEDEGTWIDILDARNATSHEYDQDKAMALYQEIKRYVPHLDRLLSRMATP